MAARDKTPPTPSVPDLSSCLGKMDPKESRQAMEYFKQQILLLREKALLQASVREEKKLLVENAKLKKDISELKIQLTEKQRKETAKALYAPVPAPVAPSPPVPSTAPSGRPVGTAALRLRGRRGEKKEERCPDSQCVLEADSQVDMSRLDIRIGRIVNVRKHPLAETLYIQEVELGESAPRTVVSKLGLNMDLEQLENSPALFLCNIRPSKIKGVTSRARLLCCSASDARIELLTPPPGALPGDRVTCRACPGEADRQLLPKERVWDRLQADLRTDARGVATYKGAGLEVKGKGQCKAPSLRDSVIKST